MYEFDGTMAPILSTTYPAECQSGKFTANDEVTCRRMFQSGAVWMESVKNDFDPQFGTKEIQSADGSGEYLKHIEPRNDHGKHLLAAILIHAPHAAYEMRNAVIRELSWLKEKGWDKYRRFKQEQRRGH